MRLAPSWFRIGSLEILTKSGEFKLLQDLLDNLIVNHFPNIDDTDSDRYMDVFENIVNNTAGLIAQWQSVGFAHGVCNTDNFIH